MAAGDFPATTIASRARAGLPRPGGGWAPPLLAGCPRGARHLVVAAPISAAAAVHPNPLNSLGLNSLPAPLLRLGRLPSPASVPLAAGFLARQLTPHAPSTGAPKLPPHPCVLHHSGACTATMTPPIPHHMPTAYPPLTIDCRRLHPPPSPLSQIVPPPGWAEGLAQDFALPLDTLTFPARLQVLPAWPASSGCRRSRVAGADARHASGVQQR